MKEVKRLKTDKIILYVLEREQFEHKSRLEAKLKALDSLVDYMNKFISVDLDEAFRTDIKQYFINQFEVVYRKDFPPYLKTEKLLDLLEVSVVLLDTLIGKYKENDIEGFNPIKRNAPMPDFSVCAETEEQIFRYNQTITLVNELNSLKDKFQQGMTPSSQIAHLLKIVSYNIQKQKFVLNYNYVLKGF